MDAISLNTGALKFKAKDAATGEEVERQLDLMMVVLTGEELVANHNLQVRTDNHWQLSPAFLQDLCDRFKDLGFPECTPTAALLIWEHASELTNELKKNTKPTPKSDSGTASTPAA